MCDGARSSGGGRERARLAVGAVGLFVGALIAGLGPAASTAYADVTSAQYSIGTPTNSVGGVVASPSTMVESATTSFAVRFMATGPLSSAAGSTITITPSSPLASTPTNVSLIDDTETECFQSGTGAGSLSATNLTVGPLSSCSINPGDQVEVDFTAAGPAVPGNFDFTVITSDNATPATSNVMTVGTTPPTWSAMTYVLGGNTSYLLSGAAWPALSQPFTALVLTAKTTSGASVSWYGGSSGYTVTYTPPNGAATPDPVNGVTVSTTSSPNDTVTLTLATQLGAGDTVNIIGRGTNPSVTSNDVVAISAEAVVSDVLSSVGVTETTTNSLLFGTLVSGVAVTSSPPVAGVPATYVVHFQATSRVQGGGGAAICLSESGGQTGFSSEKGALVSDTTAGWQFIAGGLTFASGSPPSNPGCSARNNGAVIPLPTGYGINAGDWVTVTVVGVTNPSEGTVADFTVSTSADTVPATASPYLVGASGSPGVIVSVSPSTTGSLATYTISDLHASAPMTAGSSTVTLEGPAGTVFPNSPGYYTLEDSTMPSGSGSVTAGLTGGGTNDVTMTVPGNIGADDLLTLTIEDVINPSSANTAYSIALLGNVTGPSPVVQFPSASISYPNGAIVSFSGTDYVFAGGRAFKVQSTAALSALEKVDHARPQPAPSASIPPSGTARAGTLLSTRPVNGAATLYVVGSDGELHGFATPKQFIGDGYDPALVVTVPSVSGLSIGPSAGSQGSAGNALATAADGAIVVSSGTYYVLAGGRAFAVPGPSKLAAVQRSDKAQVLSGDVPPSLTSAGVASGVLLSASGPVYVTYRGQLFIFKSPAQLSSDGYGGTAAVPVPGTGGLPVVVGYAGP
jgi:hypothetical protein